MNQASGSEGCEHPDKVPEDAPCGGRPGLCYSCKASEQREHVTAWGRVILRLSDDGWMALAVDGTVLGDVLDYTGPNPRNGVVNCQLRMFNGSFWTGRADGFGGQMYVWAYKDQENNPVTIAMRREARQRRTR